jgi:hypothetical protein
LEVHYQNLLLVLYPLAQLHLQVPPAAVLVPQVEPKSVAVVEPLVKE